MGDNTKDVRISQDFESFSKNKPNGKRNAS